MGRRTTTVTNTTTDFDTTNNVRNTNQQNQGDAFSATDGSSVVSNVSNTVSDFGSVASAFDFGSKVNQDAFNLGALSVDAATDATAAAQDSVLRLTQDVVERVDDQNSRTLNAFLSSAGSIDQVQSENALFRNNLVKAIGTVGAILGVAFLVRGVK